MCTAVLQSWHILALWKWSFLWDSKSALVLKYLSEHYQSLHGLLSTEFLQSGVAGGTASSAGSNLSKHMGVVCPGCVETLFLFLNDSRFSPPDRASSEVRLLLWTHPQGCPAGPGKFSGCWWAPVGLWALQAKLSRSTRKSISGWDQRSSVCLQPGCTWPTSQEPQRAAVPAQSSLKRDYCCSFKNRIFVILSLYSTLHIMEKKALVPKDVRS